MKRRCRQQHRKYRWYFRGCRRYKRRCRWHFQGCRRYTRRYHRQFRHFYKGRPHKPRFFQLCLGCRRYFRGYRRLFQSVGDNSGSVFHNSEFFRDMANSRRQFPSYHRATLPEGFAYTFDSVANRCVTDSCRRQYRQYWRWFGSFRQVGLNMHAAHSDPPTKFRHACL